MSPFSQGAKTLFAAVRTVLPILILFEVLYRAVTILLVKPLLTGFLQLMLNISGFQLALNDDILGFFLTVPGIVAAVVLIVVSALFIYFEFAVVIILCYCGISGHDVTLRGAMGRALRSLKLLRSPSLIGFSPYALLLLPVANLGYSSSLMPSLVIPNFITGELAKMNGGPFLVFLIYAALFIVFFCTIFTVPIMVLREVNFGKAWGESFKLLKTAGLRLLGGYGLFLGAWAVLYKVPKVILSMIFFTPDVTFSQILSAFGLFSWQTLLLGVLSLFVFLIQLFLMPILMMLVLFSYLNVCGREGIVIDLEDPALVKGSKNPVSAENLRKYWTFLAKYKWTRRLRIPAVILVVALVVMGLARMFSWGYMLHKPIVIGHRGSAYGVENTIGAIESAIDGGAEYAEVDILLSADSVPMVVHDTNLERLSGENVNVYDLTAEELSTIELYQNGYEGNISTLEQVIDATRGRIRLAIELKLHGDEKVDLVEAIFDVLKAEDYMDECIFLSMEYNLVTDINKRYPASVAGFCVFGNVGNVTGDFVRSMNVDFIIIEEAMATREVVYGFRSAWIPVYVWTVNDPRNMRQYLDMGIIGLVTDEPYDGVVVRDLFMEEGQYRLLPEDEQTFMVE